jgi:NADH-quinone oxidoreductase subunit K
MSELGLFPFAVLSAFLFSVGLFCLLTKRNTIGILMGIELLLNAANLNFVAAARFVPGMQLDGQIFAIIIIVLAAAEAAVALAIFLNFYNNHATVDVDEATTLKG